MKRREGGRKSDKGEVVGRREGWREREGWRKYNPGLEEVELLTSDPSTLSPVSMQAKNEYLSGILTWIESWTKWLLKSFPSSSFK